MFKNKILLITGGTGSFGNAVLDKLLNGTRVVEYDIGSSDWNRRISTKLKENPNFTFSRNGHIALQSHNGFACFRNIKLKIIEGGCNNGKGQSN